MIAGILLGLSWLWDPRAGFAGIGQVMNRYFMSVGMPFERWMHSLANLADQERDPDQFVMTAAADMAALPWVSGIDWQTATQRGMSGHITRHATECRLGPLRLTVYTRWSPSPTLVLHIRLLARLLADYYEAKEREQEQRRNAYMHAIYETGSRLTHDVKNLLQSLRSLCAAVDSSDEADAPALRRLLRRQLPQVAQRLQTTLDKLDHGAEAAQSTDSAGHWWRDLQQRYAHERVVFESDPLPLGTGDTRPTCSTAWRRTASRTRSKSAVRRRRWRSACASRSRPACSSPSATAAKRCRRPWRARCSPHPCRHARGSG